MSTPTTHPSFDDIADKYDETRGGQARGDMFAAAIAPLLGSAATVLEVGIGTALVAKGLHNLGFNVVGFDISGGMLRHANNRMPGRVARADAMAMPLRSGSIEAGYAVWVLHMVPDLPTALSEIRRVLVPGGRFVASSVNNEPKGDPISDLIFPMQLKLLGDEAFRDTADELAQQAAEQGLRRVPGRYQVSQEYQLAPARMADTIESRGFSNLQTVDDHRWTTIVEPVIEALRSLPAADQPVARRTVHDLTVFEAV